VFAKKQISEVCPAPSLMREFFRIDAGAMSAFETRLTAPDARRTCDRTARNLLMHYLPSPTAE
jgi:hypothetical protein